MASHQPCQASVARVASIMQDALIRHGSCHHSSSKGSESPTLPGHCKVQAKGANRSCGLNDIANIWPRNQLEDKSEICRGQPIPVFVSCFATTANHHCANLSEEACGLGNVPISNRISNSAVFLRLFRTHSYGSRLRLEPCSGLAMWGSTSPVQYNRTRRIR